MALATHLAIRGLYVGTCSQQGMYHLDVAHTAGRNEGRIAKLRTDIALLRTDSHTHDPRPDTLPAIPLPTLSLASLWAPAANRACTTSR